MYHHQQRVFQGEAGHHRGDPLGQTLMQPVTTTFRRTISGNGKPVEDAMTSGTLSRRGFTLVELLISLVVTAIIGAALVRMVVSQARFMDQQEAWRQARSVSRGGINRLFSDLRSVEAAGGMVAAAAGGQDFTVRVPYAFGVLCGTAGRRYTAEPLPGGC